MNADDEKQPMQRLADQGRVLGASRVIRDEVPPERVTQEQWQEVMENLRVFQRRTGMRWNLIARSAGLHASALSALNNRRTVPRWQEMVIELDRWLEQELSRESAPKSSPFCLTRVAEDVLAIASATVSLKCIGVVYGSAGVGKTMALKAAAAQFPGSAYLSIRTASATPIGVLQAIADAVGLRDSEGDTLRRLLVRLEQLLKDTARLLIVDEFHKLLDNRNDRCLHVLRDLHDATGVPMLWSSTVDVVAYLDRRQAAGREPLAQIRRRVGICRNLCDRSPSGSGGDGGGEPLFSIDEIIALFSQGKMRLSPEAAKYLLQLANIPESGALGICRHLVTMAEKLNAASADTLTAEMLRAVHRLLISERDYTLLQDRISEAAPTPPLAKAGCA